MKLAAPPRSWGAEQARTEMGVETLDAVADPPKNHSIPVLAGLPALHLLCLFSSIFRRSALLAPTIRCHRTYNKIPIASRRRDAAVYAVVANATASLGIR
jgi:hypothetical protein